MLIFKTQKALASTFLRFQEHYESPEFRGKIFSLDEFKAWYVQNSRKGRETREFTYYSDWTGFNIPSSVLNPFYQGKFNPLSEQEKALLERFKDEPETFYVIGVYEENENINATLRHEIAHGFFFTDEGYRDDVLDLLSQFDTEPIKEELRSIAGYHEHVLDDEVHAFIVDGSGYSAVVPDGLVSRLRVLYEEKWLLSISCE